ncbi:MAG: leucyl/phenylalanyl-tRNA--protein transferase [Acidobacteriia bacterium]|nr:leucyl/phenylalanyl-tRNA--protein transferase [Terriglobia bacterium]
MPDIKAVTRSLRLDMLEAAYREGLFPMADLGTGLVTWHCPPRRAILPLDSFHISRSLARTLRQRRFEVTFNRDFDAVMAACARAGEQDSWITPEFRHVYGELHRQGKAHSIEVRVEGQLAGGVYGVHLGGAFFAESMFHTVRDMSKVALACLVARLAERGFLLLEVQYLTPHLEQFGVIEVSHKVYKRKLEAALTVQCEFAP